MRRNFVSVFLMYLLVIGCASTESEEELLPVLEPEGYYQRAFVSYDKIRRLSEKLEKEKSETVRRFLKTELERYKKEFIAYLNRAKRLLPQDVRVSMLEGAYLIGERRYREAIGCFEAVLAVEERSAGAYFNLALCYDALGDVEMAYRNCQRALELDPRFRKAAKFIVELEMKRRSGE